MQSMRSSLVPNGLVLINFSCRSTQLHSSVLKSLGRVFANGDNDTNQVKGRIIRVDLDADEDADANNSLVGACSDSIMTDTLVNYAKGFKEVSVSTYVTDIIKKDLNQVAAENWIEYVNEWVPLIGEDGLDEL